MLFILLFASLGAIALGLSWLFGANRGAAPPTSAPTTTRPTSSPPPTLLPPILAPSATPQPSPAALPPPTSVQSPVPVRSPTSLPPASPPPAAPTPTAVRVTVPRVVGMPLGAAQGLLSAQGLILEFQDGSDPRLPEGVVLDQSPKEGESVPVRSVVRLTVNRPPTVTVPNVQGLEEAEARRIIQQAGLRLSLDRAQGGRKGVVNDQSPQPGVRVPPGSEVKIVIGS
jgi:PASTA domain-containing protein